MQNSRKSEHETKSRQQGTAIEATTCIALSKQSIEKVGNRVLQIEATTCIVLSKQSIDK
jgi:hypothetical protein